MAATAELEAHVTRQDFEQALVVGVDGLVYEARLLGAVTFAKGYRPDGEAVPVLKLTKAVSPVVRAEVLRTLG